MYNDLQAVAPNWLTSVVFFELQRGQGTTGGGAKGSSLAASGTGGAMPYFRSFSLASALSHSVVQGGEYTVLIST